MKSPQSDELEHLLSPAAAAGQPVRQCAAVPLSHDPPPPLMPPPPLLLGGSAFFWMHDTSAEVWASHPPGPAYPLLSHVHVGAAPAHATNALPSALHAEGMSDATF